jgi:hypothetical protein
MRLRKGWFKMKNKRGVVLGVALVLFASVAGTVLADEYLIDYHTYIRSDGVTKQEGVYSGSGVYRNEAGAVDRVNEGPIPHGIYTLRNVGTTNLGPVTIECIPSPRNVMYGRRGFYIHGGTRSEGCIIINDPEFRRSLDGHTLIVR